VDVMTWSMCLLVGSLGGSVGGALSGAVAGACAARRRSRRRARRGGPGRTGRSWPGGRGRPDDDEGAGR
jgi:hypothetical protein